MPRTRPPVPLRLAGLVAGSAVLLVGCSDPAPRPALPAPSASAPSASAPAATPTAASSSAAPTSAPSSATPAPAPTATGDGTVEPNRPVETAPPKRLDESTKTAGAEVSLVSVRSTDIKASGPSDSSGPGVLLRLEVVNTTGKRLDTSFVQVNVTNDAGDPGTLVSGSPTDPLTGSLKAGAKAQATYAFLLGDAGSAPVTVSVYVTSGQPVVTFRGRAS
ncbi:hypothetical protein [Microlunatus antarcticus]|uniref:Cytoskeletal protein RodZ n=1 Tax=Microlunatus antarcticus TaxID=53388 RepID=A0A7W5JS38_9ACTN|nr:hypothetical protein [Microlunatus antarcticus]MBB3325305.1 cytoskeletal protein RodZ [Microlunatus antarcticus]